MTYRSEQSHRGRVSEIQVWHTGQSNHIKVGSVRYRSGQSHSNLIVLRTRRRIGDIEPFLLHHEHGTGYRRSWNCCDRQTRFVVIWKHFCFILSTGTKIRTDSVMCPRSSSSLQVPQLQLQLQLQRSGQWGIGHVNHIQVVLDPELSSGAGPKKLSETVLLLILVRMLFCSLVCWESGSQQHQCGRVMVVMIMMMNVTTITVQWCYYYYCDDYYYCVLLRLCDALVRSAV